MPSEKDAITVQRPTHIFVEGLVVGTLDRYQVEGPASPADTEWATQLVTMHIYATPQQVAELTHLICQNANTREPLK